MPRIALVLLLLFCVHAARGGDAPVADRPFWQEFREPFLASDDAAENDLQGVALDGAGQPWLATSVGVRTIRDGRWYAPGGAEIGGPVFAVLRDASGTVWAGAWNGLYRVKDAKLEAISGPEGPISVLANCERGLLVGGPDGVWLLEGEEWKPLKGDWATSLRGLAMIGDDLWVATALGLYRTRDGKTEHFFDAEQLCTRDCRALAVDKENRLWVGTGDGIDVFEGTEHVKRYQQDEHAPPAREVRGLAFDSQGRLWAATDLGVMRWDGESWSLRHGQRWLPTDDARGVAVTDDGGAWVATAKGLAQLRRKKMTLADKAAHYQSIVRARHVREPGLVERCLLERPGDLASWKPTDTDNDGMFTGMYVIAECYRYRVTGDEQARENARAAYDAMVFLHTVTDTPGFVARTVVPSDWTKMADANRVHSGQDVAVRKVEEPRYKPVDVRWRKSDDGKWLWKGDTSSDEITGHFYAYGVYYDLAADDTEKERVRKHVQRVMDYLIEGGFELVDIDGQTTRWGVWSPRRLNHDPNWIQDRGINSVEILSYLATTYHMTGDEKYRQAAEELYSKHGYGENVQAPVVTDPGAFTYIDSQLFGMAYRGLLAYDGDAARQSNYRAGARQWFEVNRGDNSPFYNFVYADSAGEKHDIEACTDYLRDVPLDMVHWTIDHRGRNDVRLVRLPYADTLQVDRLLPASERNIQKWDKNPYAAVAGEAGRSESPAVSWLLPYWLGRYAGLIGAPEGT